MSHLSLEARVTVAAALLDGMSIRAVERLTGHHRDSIMRFGVVAGEACARLHDALVRNVEAKIVQADELHCFVQKRRRQVKPTDGPEVGDQYTYLGIDRTTKLVLSYLVGKRTGENTDAFIADLAARITGKPLLTTDALQLYRGAVEQAFGPNVDFVQIDKDYEAPLSREAAGRYAPGRIIGQTKMAVTGRPDMRVASTSHVERMNLSMRMHLRRYTRLTNAYSKKLRNLQAAVALFVAYFNFCRVHETLRVTPAMAAGLTDHVWSLAELLQAALESPPAPVPPLTPQNDPEPIAVGLSAKQAGNLTAATLRRRGLRVIRGGLA